MYKWTDFLVASVRPEQLGQVGAGSCHVGMQQTHDRQHIMPQHLPQPPVMQQRLPCA